MLWYYKLIINYNILIIIYPIYISCNCIFNYYNKTENNNLDVCVLGVPCH